MLDVGWTEILVIAIVLIIVVGPKDLPQMLRTFGRMVSKMRGMASDFRQQFDEALREADLDDVRKTIGEAQKLNPLNSIRDAVNPLRQMGEEIKSDLQKATSAVSNPTVAMPPQAEKPASAEPVAAAPLMAEPVAAPSKEKAGGDAARPHKAAAKADGAAKAATKKAPAAKKAASATPKTAKTKKDEA